MTGPMTGPVTPPTKETIGYRRPISVWWWLRKRTYFMFVMRELSSLFVAWFVVFLLMLARAVLDGEAAYQRFLDRADSPLFLVVNTVAAAFLVLHVVTWFSLTPQAMALRVRGREVPPLVVIGAQYAVLAVVSAFIYWLVTQ